MQYLQACSHLGCALCQLLSNVVGALCKGWPLKHAHGSIPQHGASLSESSCKVLAGVWPDVEALHDGVSQLLEPATTRGCQRALMLGDQRHGSGAA